MKSKTILLYIFILIISACNLPSSVTAVPLSPSPTITIPEKTPIRPPTKTPTPIPPPSDLPFTIDCSALPADRQADCDSFIAATRDQVYPIYKEVTGVSLSKCYKEIHYIILPTNPAPGAGGLSGGDTITYNQKYSIDLRHRYDVHEILHSISACTGALDMHVLHGLVMNYVYDRLGVRALGYFDPRSSENLNIILDDQLKQVKTASGQDLPGLCIGILMRKTTIVYFDLGAQAVQPLYQSTINPPESITPNPTLVTVWGAYAQQIEALLETLKQKYNYSMNVPECGY